MKNLTIRDGKEYVYFYSGMPVSESDIEILERIVEGQFEKTEKLEKNAADGQRLDILEHSHDTLWKAQIESKKMLEEMRTEVARTSRKFDHDHKAHTRIHKELDEHAEIIDRIEERNFQRTENNIKRDKRISDIEEFMRDI